MTTPQHKGLLLNNLLEELAFDCKIEELIDLTRGKMPQLLEQCLPLHADQLLFVSCLTGRERSAIHWWAHQHTLSSRPAVQGDFELFPSVFGYRCALCNHFAYDEEIQKKMHWLPDQPGETDGYFLKCPECYTVQLERAFERRRHGPLMLKLVEGLPNCVVVAANEETLKRLWGNKSDSESRGFCRDPKKAKNRLGKMPLRRVCKIALDNCQVGRLDSIRSHENVRSRTV
jgi:hypothetical protein